MQVFTSLEHFFPSKKKILLTIGNFDGIHLGHQALLEKMTSQEAESIVLTFSNHPSDVLSTHPTLRLTTSLHKLRLLEETGIHTTIMLPFTKSFSEQTAETFLTSLKKKIPFTDLLLGHDAVIGHQRKGDKEVLLSLSKSLFFNLEFIDPLTIDHLPISSTRIRQAIQQGDFEAVKKFLGRPYSVKCALKKRTETSIFCSLDGLCLPPSGYYSLQILTQHASYSGLGKLNGQQNSLEVHFESSLPDSEAEAVFLKKI